MVISVDVEDLVELGRAGVVVRLDIVLWSARLVVQISVYGRCEVYTTV